MASPLTLRRHPEVADALAAGEPVVALETALVSHGLSWPENLETVNRMRDAVRRAGAVPAVIGVCGGAITIGLSDDELTRFARGDDVHKASRRDLPVLLARGADGATTVAGTLACAALAGIRVFATGGIGGVHRNAEQTLDVSADLDELARAPVAVVCSGAKSILDLPRTLEALETRGVPVVGYRTDTFPAFFTRDSGLPLVARVDSVADAARVLQSQLALGGGLLLANPVPAPAAVQSALSEQWIARALSEAADAGVTGKAVTPFLLARVAELSGGRSREANRALLEANAGLAGELAVADCRAASRG